ncbi:4'-phosphopantetheinyl transferase family protein [Paraburkholderia sp. BCC1885]|uniref:4'-phosphopantetheinyl transferase family protein n=1 Tax=Paraburkholderia sp. BCC1885 TaxID=2562669 RepID=UPI00118332FB|nr:hypothetical protein [Paraburkholderia sp. BCC1885]
MLEETSVQLTGYAPYPAGPIRRHPIFRTPGLDFIAHQVIYRSPAHREYPEEGRLILWRVRAEWSGISREEGLASLSRAETERARYYPNPSLARRYLVGRAVLRRILSVMLNCSPAAVDLVEGADGQPHVRAATSLPLIHVAYAGTCIVIGISAVPLAVGIGMPTAGADRDAAGSNTEADAGFAATLFPDLPGSLELVQQRAWRRSVFRLATSGVIGPDLSVTTQYGAASIISTSKGQWCQVLDLPMPGHVAAAVALAGRVTRVDAFGWVRD